MRSLVFLLAAAMLHTGSNETHIRAAAEAFQDGKAAEAKKQFNAAATFFEKAIDIEPTYMEARQGLIRVNLDAGHRLEAAKAITQLLEIEPDDARDRILLGQILLEQQQTERALAQFSAALKLEPDNADALLGFAAAAAKMGMQDRARQALERGRKRYPADPRFASLAGTKPVN